MLRSQYVRAGEPSLLGAYECAGKLIRTEISTHPHSHKSGAARKKGTEVGSSVVFFFLVAKGPPSSPIAIVLQQKGSVVSTSQQRQLAYF